MMSELEKNNATEKVHSALEKKIIKMIADKLGKELSEVKLEASITDDLALDSLDTVDLMMEFEKEFNMTIPEEDTEKIKTVQDIVDVIEKKQQKNAEN